MSALTKHEGGALALHIPFGEMQQMAAAIAESGLFGMKSTNQALALMLVAQAEGAHPASITQDYDIIQGKATRKTHSVLARFQAAGGRVEWHQLTNTVAEATFSHPQGGALRLDWTLEQARSAGLTGKDNWKHYGRAMLRSRLIAEGVRAVYPAAIGGMITPEEAQDIDASPAEAAAPAATKHMGAAEVVAPPAWPADVFEVQFVRWSKAVAAGMKTAADILTMARSKGALTPEQETRIKALRTADAEPVDESAVNAAEGKHQGAAA